jgi:hypothetical protein
MARRIIGMDVFRGFMIFYVILLHPLLQRIFTQDYGQFENQMNTLPIWLILIGIPFIIIATWGSAFTFLTGTAVAYQMTQKMEQSPSDITLKTQTRSRLVNSILIMLAHYTFVLFFSNKSPDFATTSLITGYFESGSWEGFSGWMLMTGGTLESIALAGIVISFILQNLWHHGKYSAQKAIKFLSVYAVVTILIAMIGEFFQPDPLAYSHVIISRGGFWNVIGGLIYMRLFGVRFSFFPLTAFSAIGAIFGILLGSKTRFRTIAKTGIFVMLSCVITGLIYLLAGFNIIATLASEHTPMMLSLINLGLQTASLSCLLWIFDFSNSKFAQTPLVKIIRDIFLRYSGLSLTIFVIEPFISILWFRAFRLFYLGDVATNIFFIIGYELTVIATWFGIVHLWDHYDGKGSFEWIIGKLKDPLYDFVVGAERSIIIYYYLSTNFIRIQMGLFEKLAKKELPTVFHLSRFEKPIQRSLRS